MKCKNCQTLMPQTYKICPVCKSDMIVREEFAPQTVEVEEVEVISPYVEMGDISDMGSL